MDKLGYKFDVASPLLPLQSGYKTCLFCSLAITSKENNNISVSVVETLKKLGLITEKRSKVRPVFPMLKIMNWFGIRSKI